MKGGPGQNWSWGGGRGGSFDSRKLSFCADSNPPGPLPVTLPLALNISFCRKLPLSVRTQFLIKEVPSVTLKVAPLCSVVNTMVKVSVALQTDLQLIWALLCLSSTPPPLSNLLYTFCSQVEGEHHPRLVIARGTIYGRHNCCLNYFWPQTNFCDSFVCFFSCSIPDLLAL